MDKNIFFDKQKLFVGKTHQWCFIVLVGILCMYICVSVYLILETSFLQPQGPRHKTNETKLFKSNNILE